MTLWEFLSKASFWQWLGFWFCLATFAAGVGGIGRSITKNKFLGRGGPPDASKN